MEKKTGFSLTLYLGLILAAGVIAVAWLTPRGAGISPDSTVYLESAQSLRAGKGYAVDGRPITHFPPLYPSLLAAAGLFESNLVQAARLLNAALFGLNLVLIAWLSYLAAGRRLWVSALATTFAVSAEPILELHAWAWSEPLFNGLLLTSVLLLVGYVSRPRVALLASSGLSLGLAVITRYIGIGLLPAGAILVYLARPRRDRMRGLRDAAAWLALACVPLVAVFLRNTLVAGSLTDRRLAYHPIALAEYVVGVTSTLSRLIALDPWVARAGAAIIMLIAVYLILPIGAWSGRLRDAERRSSKFAIPFSCLLFCATYLPFLYISVSFLDASTPLDARILSPVLILLIVAGIPGMSTLGHRFAKPFAWWGFVAAMIVLILARLPAEIRLAEEIRRDGLGYASVQWTESETVQYARSLPAGAKVYSNAPDVLRFLNGRQTLPLPPITSALTLQPNPSYSQALDAMCKDISQGGAYLVYFDADQPWNLPGKGTLEAACSLSVLHDSADGTVYGGT